MGKQRWRIVHEPWRSDASQYFAELYDEKDKRFRAVDCFTKQEEAEKFVEARIALGVTYGCPTVVKEYGE